MNLFEFIFGDDLHSRVENLGRASHSRKRVEDLRARRNAQSRARVEQLTEEVTRLRGDVGFLTLLLGALVGRLHARGQLTRQELLSALREYDAADNIEDGALDIEALKGLVNSEEADEA